MIVLRAKDIPFEVTYIDLRNKPDWFLEISPHGKVPVLQVDGVPLFESNAIAEYLDEAETPRLHPEDLVKRARNRAWTDFLTTFTGGLSGIYYSKNPEDSEERIALARARLDKLEEAIAKERGNDGPFFNGPALSLVDAGYAPFLMMPRSHRFHWSPAVGKCSTSNFTATPRKRLCVKRPNRFVTDCFKIEGLPR